MNENLLSLLFQRNYLKFFLQISILHLARSPVAQSVFYFRLVALAPVILFVGLMVQRY